MNTKLRIKANNEFEKYFFKLMINSVFGKTQENIRKQRYIKLVTIDAKRKRLVSEPNYHTTKRFSENLLAIEIKNTKAKMNKPVYLGMSIHSKTQTLAKRLCINFGMITLKQSMETAQNYGIQILIALLLPL